MGTTSEAARRHWKNRKNRQQQSAKVRGRKFTPREPPPLPAWVRRFYAILFEHDITVIGESPAVGFSYKHAWTITAHDPRSGPVQESWDRCALEAGVVLMEFQAGPLRRHPGKGVACVIVPVSHEDD